MRIKTTKILLAMVCLQFASKVLDFEKNMKHNNVDNAY
jgi:hypothetical protein